MSTYDLLIEKEDQVLLDASEYVTPDTLAAVKIFSEKFNTHLSRYDPLQNVWYFLNGEGYSIKAIKESIY
jgi:hypothetical protein